MKKFKTPQEEYWVGEFGDSYIKRNKYSPPINLFSQILRHVKNIKSLIEFGSSIGVNLDALKVIYPNLQLSAVEINKNAAEILRKKKNIKVYNQSILDFKPDFKRDFVLIKGVLIHLNPDFLDKTYKILYESSNQYICIAEYYNPTPIEVPYHGESERLFKRDFAGEMLDKFKKLKLVDYGFTYHRDEFYPEKDDINWFLLKKF